MVTPAVTILGVSLSVLIVWLVLTQIERRRERRLFASALRGWLDRVVLAAEYWLGRSIEHFIKYVIQLHWRYGIHSLLKGVLRVVVAAYTFVERLFERNRRQTKQLRAEKRAQKTYNHLTAMAEHKAETELTPAQKKKLRKQKLEERW